MVKRKLPKGFSYPSVNRDKFKRAWWNCVATLKANYDYFIEEDRQKAVDLVKEFNGTLTDIYNFRYWVINYCLRDEDPAPFTPPEPPVPPVQKIKVFFNRTSY